jgi:hypothetical protein
VLRSLVSTCAVSLVIRIRPQFVLMPFASTKRCAYKKTTDDKRRFGHVNKLSDHHCVSYSAWAQAAA